MKCFNSKCRRLRWAAGGVPMAVVVAALLITAPVWVGAQQALQTFAVDRLAIETADGRHLEFEVELALSPEQQSQGLMFRRDLPEMAGMLFVYDTARDVTMWMKNTVIPLDMLFIERSGRIAAIAPRTVPLSLETISSGRSVTGVLELNGGTAARLNIRPGDRVRHSAFTGAAP